MHRRPRIDLAVPVGATDHIIGPEHAPVTVLEYGDFECPVCKQAEPAVKLLLQRFPERLRFVYRHFPLETLHPHALRAAEAAECAGEQGLFWPMHDEVYLQRIREHIDGGRRSHLKSTPGLFVNGVIVDVSFGLHALVDATEAALE